MNYILLQGDNRETLKTIPDNSIDAIITDPPYGISFLGKDWDSFRNSKVTKNSTVKNLGSGMRMTTKTENTNFQLWCEEWARECLRVLKPGGYMLSFCAPRMYHRMTVGLEDAGFEIRDQIMWIYSSGFPKSQDVGKSIERNEKKTKEKFTQTLSSNDAMTVEFRPNNVCINCGKTNNGSNHLKCEEQVCGMKQLMAPADNVWAGWGTALKPAHEPIAMARKPVSKGNTIAANCQQWGTGAINIDATRIESETLVYPANGMNRLEFNQSEPDKWQGENTINDKGRFPSNVIGDIPDYQKFFYCPKVNRKERHMEGSLENIHPTVKPIELMKYLIKLVTPRGGTVLDPFNGSGSTGCAAVELGHTYIGCELDAAYIEISKKRIEAWNSNQT